MRQALKPGRPARRFKSARHCGFVDSAICQRTCGRQSEAGIVDLMASGKARQWQINQACIGLEDQPAMLLEGIPSLALINKSCAELLRARSD